MARELKYKCFVKLYHPCIPPHFSQVGYHLQIHNFLLQDDGSVVEDEEARFQEKRLLPESSFGCARHRRHVVDVLRRQVGWPRRSLEPIVDAYFSRAMSILEREKIHLREKNNPRFCSIIPKIKLCIKQLRCEDELQELLESMALQLSMHEAPKPILATKESIQALKKVKLEGDIIDECMICMDRLSLGTEATSMPCSHLFHGDCIEKWLNTSHKCPLCRFPMPTDG